MIYKKTFGAMLALALCVSLCACGQTPQTIAAPTQDAQSAAAQQSPSASPSPSPAATPVPTEVQPGETAQPIPTSIMQSIYEFYGYDGETFHGPDITVDYSQPFPFGPSSTALKSGEKSGDLYWIFNGEAAQIEAGGKTYSVNCVENDDYTATATVVDPDGNKMTYDFESLSYLRSCAATVAQDGSLLLLVSVDEASDDFYTTILRVDGKKLVKVEDIQGAVLFCEDGHLMVEDHLYLLGTRPFRRSYELDAGGKPVEPTPYDLSVGSSVTVKADRALPVVGADGRETTVPGGTVLQPMQTDYDTYFTASLQDGTVVRIELENKDGQFLIDGEDQNEWFSDLFWAD